MVPNFDVDMNDIIVGRSTEVKESKSKAGLQLKKIGSWIIFSDLDTVKF